MEQTRWDFIRTAPEGAVFVALDGQEEGLLSGAVQMQGGDQFGMGYEIQYSHDGEEVSLYDLNDDEPTLVYNSVGYLAELQIAPDLLTVFWNRGKTPLLFDGIVLRPGGITGYFPEDTPVWLMQYAGWLPWQKL